MSAAAPAGPRILLACDFFLRYTAKLAGGLAAAGADVTLLTRDHGLEFGADPGAAADFVRDAAGPSVRVETIGGRVSSASGWVRAVELRRRLRARQPDVVHLQESIGTDPRLLLASGARRGRFAFTVHDPVRHPGDADVPRVARVNRALTRRAGLVFAHGQTLREEVLSATGTRAPIAVVPHGVDRGGETPLPAAPAILFFGRISRYKGLDVLLDAMPAVWEAMPAATLTIAGAGEIEPHRALGDKRVRVRAGHIPDAEVPSLIEAARCVVLPYRQASQSGVGSLAKPYGRPLVVSSVGALPELVADGSGLTVTPEDPADLAAALVSVLGDGSLATRLAAAGLATAARESSWDAVAARTLAAYREHLAPGG